MFLYLLWDNPPQFLPFNLTSLLQRLRRLPSNHGLLNPAFLYLQQKHPLQLLQSHLRGPAQVLYLFLLLQIPSQNDKAQVHLNQQLPRCGDPPPKVTVQVSFDYEFTGESTSYKIGYGFNRESTNMDEITDDGKSIGVWQHYAGPPTEAQLTYDSLFTLKLFCPKDTAKEPAILITDIYVYPK